MKKLRKTFVILITTLVMLTSFFAIGGFSNEKVSAFDYSNLNKESNWVV